MSLAKMFYFTWFAVFSIYHFCRFIFGVEYTKSVEQSKAHWSN